VSGECVADGKPEVSSNRGHRFGLDESLEAVGWRIREGELAEHGDVQQRPEPGQSAEAMLYAWERLVCPRPAAIRRMNGTALIA
jgi:hypothetical protein